MKKILNVFHVSWIILKSFWHIILILVLFIFSMIVLAKSCNRASKVLGDKIRQDGLKSIVEEVWHGTNKSRRE